ncbi:hypothetical protein ACFQI7_00455 [Paenibacillus allorhizosphaerae]|uniref:Uncharacterized protein n=1 Tax=Paenibacillus allorhizosphaerae TaxID=2849866 RepID=A0ABN7T9J7_9BACL|nr:hypothetical protein [Paenibacillus allorhizosphaerae]CAG7614117.1 hypothetical protein PAECIP111802_00045 [Paenibacillus allorhizosphaerae]
MKKKKWFMLGSVAGISAVVMLATGFSAMAGTSGYDAYKSALKNTKTAHNVSVKTQMALQDNGNAFANANGSFKVSPENRTASGTVTVISGGTDQSVSFFKQSSGTVLKSGASDIYYVKPEHTDKKYAVKKMDREMPQQVETVIDALVGNLKDYVTVESNTDGSKDVSVELTNAQIPAVVSAIAPIAIKHATSGHRHEFQNKNGTDKPEFPFDGHALLSGVPQLSQDIKIEKVAVKANINASNYIQHQEADITVSGKDAGGAAHQVTLHLAADLSGFNGTTPDTVDLTGKQVQQMKQERNFHNAK